LSLAGSAVVKTYINIIALAGYEVFVSNESMGMKKARHLQMPGFLILTLLIN